MNSRHCFLSITLFALIHAQSLNAKEYHVAKTGNDTNPGTLDKPFLTISKATQTATTAATIIIHEGIYREHVKLYNGGLSKSKPLTIRSADNEHVSIRGSEVIRSWEKDNSLWRVQLTDSFFSEENPYTKTVRYPTGVSLDREYDGVGWQTYGLNVHRGNIFINGRPLKEVFSLENVKKLAFSWYTERDKDKTYIWINSAKLNPNKNQTEAIVRGKIISAVPVGVNYVTIRGLQLHHAATFWAPPSVYQPGAIEPNGGRYWTIEDNDIGFSRAVCISVGNPNGEREGPLQPAYHIIRKNKIHGCGQSGIAGQYYADNSLIANNIIENINIYREFGGWETAGIKLHHNDYSVIENNLIRNIYTIDPKTAAAHGIWLDFHNTYVIIRNNVVLNTEALAVLLEANWNGPILVFNNIFVGDGTTEIATYSSCFGLWAHNLFVDAKPSWLNQAYGMRPPVEGDRWFNNIFIGKTGMDGVLPKAIDFKIDNNLHLDGSMLAKTSTASQSSIYPANFSIYIDPAKAGTEVKVNFELQPEALAQNIPSIKQFLEELEVESIGIADLDILGERRNLTPQWGPFEKIKAGLNDFTVKIQ